LEGIMANRQETMVLQEFRHGMQWQRTEVRLQRRVLELAGELDVSQEGLLLQACEQRL